MELRDFISETLKQVIDGVKVAQEHAGKHGAKVNPADISFNTNTAEVITDLKTGGLVRDIEFDVAVTTTEGTQTQGGIGVFVGPVGLGSKGQSDASNSSVNRIKFSIPLSLPPGHNRGG